MAVLSNPDIKLALVFDRRNGDQYVCFGYCLLGGEKEYMRTAYGETREEAYNECVNLINKARIADGMPRAGIVRRLGRVTRAVGSNFLF